MVLVAICVNLADARPQVDPTLTVLVHDHTGLPPAALQEVESATSLLLSRGGIRLQWILCRAAWIPNPPDACMEQVATERVVLRIIDHPIGGQVYRGEKLAGAVIEHRYATLYTAEIRSSARRWGVQFVDVMAYAAAHEIGHLLLGADHRPAGIMQAVWSKTVYRDIAQRWLSFHAAESAVMRDRLR